jgi:hypothetical protein
LAALEARVAIKCLCTNCPEKSAPHTVPGRQREF